MSEGPNPSMVPSLAQRGQPASAPKRERSAGGQLEPAATPDGVYPSHELPLAERLRQVVVGAKLKTPDLVVITVLPREHDHPDLGCEANLFQQIKSASATSQVDV